MQASGAALQLHVAASRAPHLDVQTGARLVALDRIPERAQGVGHLLGRTITITSRLFQTIEIAMISEALNLVDQRSFAREVIVDDALTQAELFTDLSERGRGESLTCEALRRRRQNRSDAGVLPVGTTRSSTVFLVRFADRSNCFRVHHGSFMSGQPVSL